LYLEGRLAIAANDTAGAVNAYRHFLALRGVADRASGDIAAARAQLQQLGVAIDRSGQK
jgi:hypothetical protein